MNKKAIWLIVGLMSIALVGVVVMQAYWIDFSVDLNRAQFDKNVRLAIYDVSRILENEELQEVAISQYFPTSPFRKEITEEDMFNVIGADQEGENSSFVGEIPPDSVPPVSVDVSIRKTQYYEDPQSLMERVTGVMTTISLRRLPLVNRFDPIKLNNLLADMLESKGIKLDYEFGVFDNKQKRFVVSKKADEEYPHSSNFDQASMVGLFSSPLYITLYPNYESGYATSSGAGRLFINFPGKSTYIMSSVYPMLLGVIIFTGIILFCFIYTVQVIFQQKKLSEIKNDFLNNMTHEFKTPIATISLAADSITNPIISGNSDKVTRFANIIKQENKRMNNQVERVLQMALIDKRDFRMSVESLNVNEIIVNAVRPFTLQVEKREGKIIQQLQAQKPIVQADKTHLSNVVQNLLDNANKYSPEAPVITIKTKDMRNGVQISVKDQGLGMSKEDRRQIFNKFFRVHTGNRHDVKGFGLGLSYVKAIVEAHGGHISVKSDLGKGSEFILFFPAEIPPK